MWSEILRDIAKDVGFVHEKGNPPLYESEQYFVYRDEPRSLPRANIRFVSLVHMWCLHPRPPRIPATEAYFPIEAYSDPQARNARVLEPNRDQRVAWDTYGFGVVAWDVLSGKSPVLYGRSGPLQHRDDLSAMDMPRDCPEQGKDLVRRCLGEGTRPSFEMIQRELENSICELALEFAGAVAETHYQLGESYSYGLNEAGQNLEEALERY